MLEEPAQGSNSRVLGRPSLLRIALCWSVLRSQWPLSGVATAPVASTSDKGPCATRKTLRFGLSAIGLPDKIATHDAGSYKQVSGCELHRKNG